MEERMNAKIRNDDGSLSDAVPIGYIPGIDFEVHGTGPYHWRAYVESGLIGSDNARTRLGLRFALWRAKRRWRRRSG
jgi:hypothetical protein